MPTGVSRVSGAEARHRPDVARWGKTASPSTAGVSWNWSASRPFRTARRSVVGLRSRRSNSCSSFRPGQSAMTRPPLMAPPARNATGRRAVVRADRAVDARGAAEFGDGHHGRILPAGAEALFKGLECAVDSAEQLGEAPGRAAFVGVRVPAIEREGGDARSVIGRHQLGRASAVRRMPARRVARRCACASMPSRVAMRSVSRPWASAVFRIGIAMRVEVHDAAGEIVCRGVGDLRRPAKHRRLPAHDQRGRWSDGETAASGARPATGRAAIAVDPTGLDVAGRGIAAFQDVLAVEVGALAVAGRGGVHDPARPSLKRRAKTGIAGCKAKKLSSGMAG